MLISFKAAAFTAGIAAYFLQLANLGLLINDDLQPVDTTPRGLKDYIIAQSWPRVARYQTKAGDIVCPGLWNTANLAQRVCPWNPNPPAALFARQEGDTCEIPLPSSSSSSSSTPSSTATSTGSPTPPPPSTTSPPSSTTSEQSSTTGSQTTSTSEAPVVNKGVSLGHPFALSNATNILPRLASSATAETHGANVDITSKAMTFFK